MFKWKSLLITIITGLLLTSNPASARFYSVDPVGFQESNSISFNRYGYANNNPYGFTDPNGELPVVIPDPGFMFRSEVHGFAKGVGATALDVVTLDPSFTNGDLVLGKTVNPDEEFGYLVGRSVSSLGLGKASLGSRRGSGGVYRANKYSSNWNKVNINDAIGKFAGKEPSIAFTPSGKRTITNNETGIQIVHDVKGNYFRVNDTNVKSKRSFLDMDGNIPNNKTTDKGTQQGRTQSEYNEATHFNMDD